MTLALILLLLASAAALLVRKASNQSGPNTEATAALERAIADERSSVGRMLLSMSRPLTGIEALRSEARSPAWEGMQRRVVMSGHYGASFEVFLAAQTAAIFLSIIIIAVVSLVAERGDATPAIIGGLLFAVAIAAWPWNVVSKSAKKRENAVSSEFPAFAELLQMALSAGMGILPALGFVADRVEGLVGDEVRRMVSFIHTNPKEEASAFIATGDRLGTPEAKAFFVTLLQAHIEGAKVTDQLARQAESIRVSAFQRTRGRIKKIPVTLVLMFALHLLPLLFALTLLPTLVSLGSL